MGRFGEFCDRLVEDVKRSEVHVMELERRGVLLTAGEVAGRLKVPRSWVYRAARAGDLPSVRCGRYRRFDEGDVERWTVRQKGSVVDGPNCRQSGGVDGLR